MKNNNNSKTAVVFDFGGVLIDWNPHYLYHHYLGDDPDATHRFLQAVDFSGWNQENDRGRTLAEGVELLAARYPYYRELILAYDTRYLETVGGCIQPVVDILQSLKEQGYPLYGLSNWPAEKFAQVRQIYPFFEWFDDMVISGEVKLIKPGREIFELMLQRIGRPARECIYIDDHEPNISAARQLDFQTIQYQSPEQLRAELHAKGVDIPIS